MPCLLLGQPTVYLFAKRPNSKFRNNVQVGNYGLYVIELLVTGKQIRVWRRST